MTTSSALSNLGFLTVAQEAVGYYGGYLITNSWGWPLEYRMTSAVQPSRVQQILYGESLLSYLCGELIGKTLVDKTALRADIIFTDTPSALELRRHSQVPVALVQAAGPRLEGGHPPLLHVDSHIACHAFFASDLETLPPIMERLGNLDLHEPFERVREALIEARKMGVGLRAA